MKVLNQWSWCAVTVAAAMALAAPIARAGDLTLEVSGECPGQVTVRWSGAEPDRPMAICFGERQGIFTLPNGGPCGGSELGIQGSVRLITVIWTRSNGEGAVMGQASERECGGYLQLLVNVGNGALCAASNVEQIPG